MTPDQISQAATLLADLQQLRAQRAAFSAAASFQISAVGIGAVATFPASVYLAQLQAAFDAQIAGVTTQLDALGVTGY